MRSADSECAINKMNTNLWLRALRAVVALIPLCLGIAGTAWAADDAAQALGLSNEVYTASAKALTMLFVTAVVLESAFAVIFNWRVFLAYFDTRGLKTIVMIVISTIVVFLFQAGHIRESAGPPIAFRTRSQDPAGLAASLPS